VECDGGYCGGRGKFVDVSTRVRSIRGIAMASGTDVLMLMLVLVRSTPLLIEG
jgi:hypothetical protein